MKKERVVVQRILDIIQADDFKIGSVLPSERKLATELGTSRNTVRNALRQLEARGFVDVRRGSGYYLLSKDDRPNAHSPDAGGGTSAELQSLFEARYLFEPEIGALSARKITLPLLTQLEKCLVRLSRVIIGAHTRVIISEDVEFRKIIASGTGNPVMVAAIFQWRAANHRILANFPEFNDREKDALFAGYVDILNALKKHHPVTARAAVQANILRCCALAVKYAHVDMPELIREALERKKEASRLVEEPLAAHDAFRGNDPMLKSKEGRKSYESNI